MADGIDWEDVLEDVEEEDDKFVCTQCGKRVRTEIGLRRHSKIHMQNDGKSATGHDGMHIKKKKKYI